MAARFQHIQMQEAYNKWLHACALLTAAATLVLICLGGLVTSHEAGLAVPDWPTTFGYNMFFFPISKWVGGVFYEHTHRLVASEVGLLTVFLALWLWLRDGRRWMRWMGGLAVFSVVLQGVLGGLRVTALKDEIGIFHGALAQVFFVLMCSIALFTSKWWWMAERRQIAGSGRLPRIIAMAAIVIFAQLMIGATMRHQHAGLAIPDFPSAYGKVWPDTTPQAIERYNRERHETTAIKPITAGSVQLQMAHRLNAILVFALVACVACVCWRQFGPRHALTKLALCWVFLILGQAMLGAATIWTNKSADIATAHVALGALSLALATMFLLVVRRSFSFNAAPHAAARPAELSIVPA